jgi:hypothetical protein
MTEKRGVPWVHSARRRSRLFYTQPLRSNEATNDSKRAKLVLFEFAVGGCAGKSCA